MQDEVRLTRYDIKMLGFALLVGVAGTFGIDMHLPSLPNIVSYFHSTMSKGQLSVSLYLLGCLVMQLFYGPLSDKHGRKYIVVLGMAVAIVGSVICYFAANMNIFLFGRLVQGMGAAVSMGIGRSIVSDVMSKKKMAMYGSFLSVFMTVGMMCAPVVGGYVQHGFGWHAVFIALGVFYFIALILFAFVFPETCRHKNPNAMNLHHLFANYWTLIKSPVFIVFNLISGFAMGAALAYTNVSSFLFQGYYHLSPVVYGWLGVLIGAAGIVGKILSGLVVRKRTIEFGIRTGLSIILITGVVFAASILFTSISVYWVLALIFISVVGQGFLFANAMAGSLTPFRHMGGSAGALFGSLQYTVGFIVSFAIALTGFHSAMVLAVTYLVLSVLGLILFRNV